MSMSCVLVALACAGSKDRQLTVHQPGISGNCSVTDEDGDWVGMVPCSDAERVENPAAGNARDDAKGRDERNRK